jgi:hypothetical protein
MDLLGFKNVELEMPFPDDVTSSNMSFFTYFLPSLEGLFLILSVCIYPLYLLLLILSFCSATCPMILPRFMRQTGFVMNSALCMEIPTTDGWNPVNDIESMSVVSIRSLLVVRDGRLEAATQLESDEVRANATRKKKAADAEA